MKPKTAYILLAAIILAGFMIRLALFMKYPYVSGTDGGYYVYNTDKLMREGSFGWSVFSVNPVIFYVSAFFSLFFGVDAGVTIATSIFSVLLGLSVFILAQYLFRNEKVSLIAAFLVVFSPLALRMMADVRKNVAGLFFVPLIFYFILKSFEDRKYLVGVAITGILGILSHPTVIFVGFVMLSYIALEIGMGKKVSREEVIVMLILGVPALLFAVLFSSEVASGLSWIAAGKDMGGSDPLTLLVVPLFVIAIPGAYICIKKQDKEHLFLLSWITICFLLTLPAICGSQAWRFNLMFFVPLAIAAGLAFDWFSELQEKVSIAAVIVVFAVVFAQFMNFGMTHDQMRPMMDVSLLDAIKASGSQVPSGAVVYTSTKAHPTFWIEYLLGRDVIEFDGFSSPKGINQNLSGGNRVFFIDIVHGARSNWESSANFRKVYDKDGVALFEVSRFIDLPPEKPAGQSAAKAREPYDFGRLRYLSVYLILPYELVYALNPPYLEFLLVLIGFTGSVLVMGLVFHLLSRLAQRVGDAGEHMLMILFIAVVLFLYAFHPAFFWGSAEMIPPQSMQLPEVVAAACVGKTLGNDCTMDSPEGNRSGRCEKIGDSLACMVGPENPMQPIQRLPEPPQPPTEHLTPQQVPNTTPYLEQYNASAAPLPPTLNITPQMAPYGSPAEQSP